MFFGKTVFVVGAGASTEFGLPAGLGLRDRVGHAVRLRDQGETSDRRQQLLLSLNRLGMPLSTYADAGMELASALPLFPSLDEALHYFSASPEIVRLGKLSIALEIMATERASALPSHDDWNGIGGYKATNKSWLFHFLSIAMRGTTKTTAADIFANVTIINFNYDRTIEHFLYLTLQNQGRLKPDAARLAIRNLRILRPYGEIGPLPWENDGNHLGIDYGVEHPANHVDTAAGNILTFTEQRLDADLKREVGEALKAARLIVFLGFGFHPQNMEVLALPRRKYAQPNVLATKVGIHAGNDETLVGSLKTTLSAEHSQPSLYDLKGWQLLNDLQPRIVSLVGRPDQ